MTTSASCVDASTDAIENLTPHNVITLLLDGALERVDKAISRLSDGDIEEAALLVKKTIAIVSGLRESLNFENGGDIAQNLDVLYEYIVTNLNAIGDNDPLTVLKEVRNLLNEVHMGWSGIATKI